MLLLLLLCFMPSYYSLHPEGFFFFFHDLAVHNTFNGDLTLQVKMLFIKILQLCSPFLNCIHISLEAVQLVPSWPWPAQRIRSHTLGQSAIGNCRRTVSESEWLSGAKQKTEQLSCLQLTKMQYWKWASRNVFDVLREAKALHRTE